MVETRKIRPQPGYQTKALSSKADIVIGGAAAGVGKTYSLLLEFLRHIGNPGWGGVVFRRTSPQIRSEGGLWDTSKEIYPYVNAEPKEGTLSWQFPAGGKLKFSHLEHEKNIFDWQGSQIPFIAFDELTHFTKKMFFYLLTRNRSVCGVKPYIRASCNPDPDSWVAEFIAWWIDPETGFPIPERDGVIRYLVRNGETYIWGDSEAEVIDAAWFMLEPLVLRSGIPAKEFVKSVTFISGSIYDNQELLKVNPAYLSNLISQDEETVSQLFHGNWRTVISENELYNYVKLQGAFDNSYSAATGEKYITADIALEGSNMYVVIVWDGFEIIDIILTPRSKGDVVIAVIKEAASKYKVQNCNICYDADGVGGFIDGFIHGSKPFHGGAPVVEIVDTVSGEYMKENYKNLKAQCYYHSANRVNVGGITVAEEVGNRMYDDKMTMRKRILHERKAIKKDKVDTDGKKCIISKKEMKTILGGSDSPDLLDAIMMREIFELDPIFNLIAL